jgi:hypothetical protein
MKVKCKCHDDKTDSVAPGPEGSLQCSQEPATGPYPEAGESAKHPHRQSP